MQKYHDEPKQYKGYLKSALVSIGAITCVVPGRFSTAPGGNELLAA